MCTTRESLVLTTTGGGLIHTVSRRSAESSEVDLTDSRPGSVDAYHASFGEAVRVSIFDIGDIPPDFVHACQDRRGERREGEHGLHPGRYGCGRWIFGVGGELSAGKPALCLDCPGIYAGRSQARKWAIA